MFATVWLQGALLVAAGVLLGALLGWGLGHTLGAFAAARTGLAIHATPGAAEVWSLAELLIMGSLLAALPSFATMRSSTRKLLRHA